MAKKNNSKRKRSQVKKLEINKGKFKPQETIGEPEIQLATNAERSAKNVSELQDVLESTIHESETKADKASVSDGVVEAIEVLPTLAGALDAFVPPSILRGWAFSHEGANLRVRIFVGSSILGEAPVNITRSDLMRLNNGLTGWRLEIECQLSEQEFLVFAKTIRVVVLDESNNMIGLIPIWSKLLEKLTVENNDALALEKKTIA